MIKHEEHRVYEFDRFRLDAASAMLYENGEAIALPPRAVETLLALAARSGEIVPKNELMSMIWPESIVEESNLSQYLHILRKTLGETADGRPFIETLKRRGYRFNGEVTSQMKGSARPTETIDRQADSGARQAAPPARSLRVQRRGNVLALADWKENVPATSYSPEPIKLQTLSHRPAQGRKFRAAYFAGATLAVMLLAAATIIWLRSASGNARSGGTGDVSFINLTSGEDVNAATISPDGNYFVYASYDGTRSHLWLQQTGQPKAVEVIPPFPGAVIGTTFTPDSTTIYFVVSEGVVTSGVLYRVPTLGGTRSRISTDVADAVSFSPDGSEMVFRRYGPSASQSSIVLASSDGKDERILLTLTASQMVNSSPAWSPDGQTIAYTAVTTTKRQGGCTIAAIEPETGKTRLLSPEAWDNCFRLAWTHDGEGLIFSGTKGSEAYSTRRDQIHYLSAADGVARRVTTDGTSRHDHASLGVTHAGEILIVPFNRFSQIWTMDANGDSRTAVQVTTGFADGRGGIAPVADAQVAYLTRNGDGFSIWRMRSDGSERQQLTTEPSQIEELRAAPDGSFFVFSAKRDGWPHLYRVDANGGQLTQLTFGESEELDSSVSPDGKWIIYNSKVFKDNYGKSSLWKIGAQGGTPIRVADTDCMTPHFSPDGRFIACVRDEPRLLSIIDVESGETVQSLETAANPILNVGSRWASDGKSLTYIVKHKNIGNVWIHPVDGGPARPLTDFTSGDVYNYAFSIDGSRLHAARGYPTRNAVLIKGFR